MKIVFLYESLSVSGQIKLSDLKLIAAKGITTIINNRPDGEAPRQPRSETLDKRAKELGLTYHYIPVISGAMTGKNAVDFASALNKSQGPVLAFCWTGTRSTTLWAKSQKGLLPADAIIKQASNAGYDLSKMKSAFSTAVNENNKLSKTKRAKMSKENTKNLSPKIVIIGGGSVGIATAASLLKRRPGLDIAIIEPKDEHFYQLG